MRMVVGFSCLCDESSCSKHACALQAPSERRTLLDVMCGAGSCSSGSGQAGDVLWHTRTHVHCRHLVNAVHCWM